MSSTSAHTPALAAIDLAEAQTIALFAQLREHIGRTNPHLDYRGAADRHDAIRKCLASLASNTADVMVTLGELGSGRDVEDFRETFATTITDDFEDAYGREFDDNEALAREERRKARLFTDEYIRGRGYAA